MTRTQIDELDDDADLVIKNPRLGKSNDRVLVTDITDPFKVAGEDLRKMRGITPATRRTQTRKMEKVYAGHEGAGTKRDEVESQVDAYNLFGVVLPKYNLDYLAKIYEMSAPHYAAVKAKVANIAGLGFDFVLTHAMQRKLSDAQGDGKDRMRRKLDRVKEDLYAWLDGCNEEDTFVETLIKVWTDYEVTGNGYLEIGRTLAGEIGYIGHIPSSTIRIRKDRDGYVQVVSNRVKFFRNFGSDDADPIGNDPQPNEIIHIKKYSPTNQFYGVPDVVAAQQAIVGNEFASRFNLDYFENKAVPRYVIVVKGGSFSAAGEQNLLEFFETGLKGRNHRTIYVPLPADESDRKHSFEMKPVEAGTQDSSFVNYRRGNLSDILMAHRVPVTKISASEANVGLAAARDMDKNFKEQVCRPEQKMFEKKINKIIGEVTDIFKLKLNELVLTDEDTQSKIDERLLRLGATTVNEVRARKGESPLPWGDERAEIAATALSPDAIKQQDKQMKQQAKTAEQTANATANEQRAQASGNRERDQSRAANATDSAGEGRNTQGEGRTTA